MNVRELSDILLREIENGNEELPVMVWGYADDEVMPIKTADMSYYIAESDDAEDEEDYKEVDCFLISAED